MKILVILLLSAIAAFAQYTPPSEDIYGGLTAVSCTNGNTAFKIVTVNNRLVFCSQLGHVLPMARGPFGFDPNLVTTTDESGHSYYDYMFTVGGGKYSGGTAQWVTQELGVMKNLGLNSLPTYANVNALPPAGPSVKVPFVLFEIVSAYAIVNKLGWGSGPVKELGYLLSSTWGGFLSSTGVADYPDPNWQTMIDGSLAHDTTATQLASASSTTKGYLLGYSADDSDGTHCFGAGPDFTTQPAGNNDYRCGYYVLFVAPTDYANSVQQQIYSDPSTYWRKMWADNLYTEYAGSTSALNTAWGSSYTTFGTSGTAVGTLPTGIRSAGSTLGAEAYGTGNGSTTTFAHTLAQHTSAISHFSLGIYIGGVLVGGDTGNGSIYGTGCGGLTGTVNYSTGAASITCTTAPANGAAITANYIMGGWGVGTGLQDEDCRSGHASYCGNGSGNTSIYMTGLSSAMQADLNAFTQSLAGYYASTYKTHLATWAAANGFTGSIAYLGPTTLGTWTTPPDRYVLQGFAGNADAWMYGGQSTFTQAELDFVHTYGGTMGLIEGEYRTANAQSPFAWPGSACTNTGSTVTCTVATPNKFSALAGNSHIDATCTNTTYQASNVNFTATSSTVTYTATTTPSGGGTTCNVFFDDANVGGFPTQAARWADFQTKVSALPTRAFTTGGLQPYVGYFQWDWYANWAEQLDWGIETQRGNLYNGVDDTNSIQACASPNGSFSCGGELALHGPPLGNGVTALQATNTAIDNAFLGGPVIPTWPANSTPTSPGPVSLGVTGYHPSWCWANCVAGGEISYYAPRGDGSGRYDIWTMAQSLTSGFTCHTCTSTYLNTQLSDRTSGNAEWCPNGDCVVFQAQTSTSSLTPTQASPGTGLDNFLGAVNPNFTSGFQVLDQDPDATGGFLQFRFSHDGNWLFGGHEYAQGGTTTGVFGIAGYARVYSVTYPSGVITLSGTGISGFGAPITYASISGTAPTGTVTCVLTAANGTTSTGALVYGVMNAISGSFTGQTLRVIFAGNGYSTIPTQWSTSGTGCGDGTTRVTTTGGKLYGADYKLPDSSQAYFVEGGDSSIDSKWLYFSAVGSTTQAFLLYRMNITAPAPAATIELFTPAGTQWSEVPRVSPAGLPCFVSSWFTGVTPPATIGPVALDVACQAADKQTIWPITFFNQAATMPVWRISPNTPVTSEVFAFPPNGSGILLNASDGVSIAGLYWIPFRYTTGITTGNGASTGNGLNF
jgi:hypothetical protein